MNELDSKTVSVIPRKVHNQVTNKSKYGEHTLVPSFKKAELV